MTKENIMCLAVPLKIKEITGPESALVSQGETDMEVNISLLEGPKPGDYVIVHAGFAIEILGDSEANEIIELYDNLQENPYE